MDGGTLLMIVAVGLPALGPLMRGAIMTAIACAGVAFLGVAVFVTSPALGGGIWFVAVLLAGLAESSAKRDRKHRQLLRAIERGQIKR